MELQFRHNVCWVIVWASKFYLLQHFLRHIQNKFLVSHIDQNLAKSFVQIKFFWRDSEVACLNKKFFESSFWQTKVGKKKNFKNFVRWPKFSIIFTCTKFKQSFSIKSNIDLSLISNNISKTKLFFFLLFITRRMCESIIRPQS